jgi:putative membrane protein
MKTFRILILAAACAALATACSPSDKADTSKASAGSADTGAHPNPAVINSNTAPNPATTSSSDTKAVLNEPDRLFFMRAAQSGFLEIEASKMAQNQASAAPIKSFASTMISDHTAADSELKALAAQKKVTLPENDAGANQADLDRLKKLKGAAFDTAYAQRIGVSAHNEAVALFDNTSKSAADADVKSFAAKTLQTLQHHLEMAKTLPHANDAGPSPK